MADPILSRIAAELGVRDAQVAAAVALTINYYVVNIFVVGLHSYA